MEEFLRGDFLPVASDTLDDIEHGRIQMENRIRALTKETPDKDGLTRGPCLPPDHPDVARLVDMLRLMNCQSSFLEELTGERWGRKAGCCLEHDAERNLTVVFRTHPLYPWFEAQKGIGAKQGARLLAAIGDPFVRPEIELDDGTVEVARPRRGPDELKAYVGMDVRDGKAPARRKGVKMNWNGKARMRLYLVAAKCVQVGHGGRYREVYDIEREYLTDAVHRLPCERCGPSGKPAAIGSALSDGHKHARAIRKVAQAILIDLFVESKRLYEVNGWLAEEAEAAA
jgi:hypothetical protein